MTVFKVSKTLLKLPKLKKNQTKINKPNQKVVEHLRNKKHVRISEILEKCFDFS